MTRAAWQDEILSRGELFRVGGCVRDELLQVEQANPVTDFVVRGLPPEELEAILARHGRVAFVGRAFGVYKFTPGGEGLPVDIAYPRREVSTGVGHRDFEIQADWNLPIEEDLVRRDFTINAIAERVGHEGRWIDPTGGVGDLEARVLRAIFPRAFVEDPLRIVRGARFVSRFSLRPAPETLQLMREAAALVATVSAERVQEEFSKILDESERPGLAFDLLHQVGALGCWLPELERCAGVEQNEYHPDDIYWHTLKTLDAAPRGNRRVRWAALLHDLGKVDTRQTVRDELGERVVFYGHESVSAVMAAVILERLRYPREFVAGCRLLVEEHMFHYESAWKPATVRRLMRRMGTAKMLDDLLLLREADCRSRQMETGIAEVEELRRRVEVERMAVATLHVTDLAVDGAEVMRLLGIGPGPAVGSALEQLLERVTDDPSLNEPGALRRLLREMKGGVDD